MYISNREDFKKQPNGTVFLMFKNKTYDGTLYVKRSSDGDSFKYQNITTKISNIDVDSIRDGDDSYLNLDSKYDFVGSLSDRHTFIVYKKKDVETLVRKLKESIDKMEDSLSETVTDDPSDLDTYTSPKYNVEKIFNSGSTVFKFDLQNPANSIDLSTYDFRSKPHLLDTNYTVAVFDPEHRDITESVSIIKRTIDSLYIKSPNNLISTVVVTFIQAGYGSNIQ